MRDNQHNPRLYRYLYNVAAALEYYSLYITILYVSSAADQLKSNVADYLLTTLVFSGKFRKTGCIRSLIVKLIFRKSGGVLNLTGTAPRIL